MIMAVLRKANSYSVVICRLMKKLEFKRRFRAKNWF